MSACYTRVSASMPKENDNEVLKYIVEILVIPFIGTVAVFVSGLVLALLPVDSRAADELTFFPPWPAAIAVGVIICIVRNRPTARFTALFAWILPAVYFLLYIQKLWSSQVPNYDRQGWDAMFAHTCSGENCFDPAVACIPLVVSVSYSVAAGVLRFKGRNGGHLDRETP